MTTLQLITPASVRAATGAAWTLAWWALDDDGNPTNAEVPTVTVTRPDGSTTSPVPSYTLQSTWTAQYTITAAGRHLVHIATVADAVDAALFVDMVLTSFGMPTADDCVDYLGERGRGWSVQQITGAYNAELGAQRDKCGERAVYPYPLREALFRRVSRNLAMRSLPLAVPMGDADVGPAILPGNDPEVRRLEAPYRRLVTG